MAAVSTLKLTVCNSLTGNVIAVIPEAAAAWTSNEVVARLPALAEEQQYKFVFGERLWERGVPLSDHFSDDVVVDLTLQALVARDFGSQEDMDMKLIKAAGHLDKDLVCDLLAAGANARFLHDPPGTWGATDSKTALHMVLQSNAGGEGDEKTRKEEAWRSIVGALLDAGADVNAVRKSSDWRGCGSSQSAFEMVLRRAMEDADLLRKFLAAGANPNTKKVHSIHSMRTDGCTTTFVLHTASAAGSVDVVQALLDAGADVDALQTERIHNERNYNKISSKTSLHIALTRGNATIAALLLKHQADPNKVYEFTQHEEVDRTCTHDDPRADDWEPSVQCVQVKETPLHLAIKAKQPCLVALLVHLGADRGCPCRYGDDEVTTAKSLCEGDERLLAALDSSGWSAEWLAQLPQDARASAEAAAALVAGSLAVV